MKGAPDDEGARPRGTAADRGNRRNARRGEERRSVSSGLWEDAELEQHRRRGEWRKEAACWGMVTGEEGGGWGVNNELCRGSDAGTDSAAVCLVCLCF